MEAYALSMVRPAVLFNATVELIRESAKLLAWDRLVPARYIPVPFENIMQLTRLTDTCCEPRSDISRPLPSASRSTTLDMLIIAGACPSAITLIVRSEDDRALMVRLAMLSIPPVLVKSTRTLPSRTVEAGLGSLTVKSWFHPPSRFTCLSAT